MTEISNRTIAGILLIALAITIIGSFVSVQKLLEAQYRQDLISGAATANATGTAAIQVSSSTAITNQVASINFSSGYVNSSCGECRMDSDVGKAGVNCCVSWSNVTSGFLLENTGNANLSINWVCAGNCTAASLLGGTKSHFEIKWTANSVAAQSGESGLADTGASCGSDFNATYENVTAAGKFICGNASLYKLDFNNSIDAFVIDVNLTIPSDARTTQSGIESNARLTFNASSSG